MKTLLFYLGFATLMAHELDAMTQSEWRLLFVLRRLSEPIASSTFVILHVPLLAGILWLSAHRLEPIQHRSRLAFAAFLIIHAGLHKHLEHHPDYTFTSSLSLGLIYGAGLLGLAYIVSVLLVPQLTKVSDSAL